MESIHWIALHSLDPGGSIQAEKGSNFRNQKTHKKVVHKFASERAFSWISSVRISSVRISSEQIRVQRCRRRSDGSVAATVGGNQVSGPLKWASEMDLWNEPPKRTVEMDLSNGQELLLIALKFSEKVSVRDLGISVNQWISTGYSHWIWRNLKNILFVLLSRLRLAHRNGGIFQCAKRLNFERLQSTSWTKRL